MLMLLTPQSPKESLCMSDSEQPDFSGLGTSLEIRSDQKTHFFSTYADYEKCLVEQGACLNECDLRTNEAVVLNVHRHWHRQGQTGCWFAQDFSKTMDSRSWRTVVNPQHRHRDFAQRLAQDVQDAIDAPECELLSVVLPRLTTAFELLDLVRQCRAISGWILDESAKLETLVGIQIRIPLGGATFSWVLGFGQFDFLPITRQAPFTELAVRTKFEKQLLSHKDLNTDANAAHLADIPSGFTQTKFDKCMANTANMKKRILGCDESPLAKAKVTFAIPQKLWAMSND